MTIKVFAWPPVGVTGAEWAEIAPVEISRSLTTGRDYTSAAQCKRLVAALDVSALALGEMGAGYMEALKRHLEGVHAVRLRSYPINWRLSPGPDLSLLQSQRLAWSSGGDPLEWTAGGFPLTWFTGAVLIGTTGAAGGWPIITVSGLPPLTLIARPGEFLTAFADMADDDGFTAQITAPATSDAAGVAVIRLIDALPALSDVRVNLSVSQTAVFRPVTYPRAMQPLEGDWTYSWQFRQIFADEVGGFEELDPWS